MKVESLNLQASAVRFLPIVSAFVKKIGVVEEVNCVCASEKEVSPGHVVMAFIPDALSGRSPLYRLERSFNGMDLELLLGVDIPSSRLNDDALGGVLDLVWEAGTGKMLTAVALREEKMYEFGQDNPLYVADSALVTEDNLELMSDEEKGFRFVTRLPATYAECEAAITRAVQAESWEDLGVPAEDSSNSKRPPAHYHGFETNVTLYERTYRALVVHSSAHDKRKMKKLERLLTQDLMTYNLRISKPWE